ncbi:Peptidase aspartic, catalytic [Cucumis melo var. makuwa]|uniref:Peptidase aspartic, catalytic n=1 Tax=Cucumis melo var. makuwa TaxID=1194695 RepID=A0A5A7UY03_CUCMM|nr:Peptidase aspartic, catalytic [Cucumis melo var. makuwa]TYK24870.1 Peptidase aspartic, catalytic [Cucumis melo var. makuwa]
MKILSKRFTYVFRESLESEANTHLLIRAVHSFPNVGNIGRTGLPKFLIAKPEVNWTDVEEQASVGNARAINAIFNSVDLNVFKVIYSCITAKEAWRILEFAYEGTSKVKISRLQLITLKFEALKMSEDESVSKYNEGVLEIANESPLLGEKIPNSKIVWKVLWSLSRKFDMKVTTIEEAHDITTLKLDELFGSLLTFEMAISDRENNKGKGVTFKSTYEEEATVNHSDNEANMDELIALLTKQKDGENTTRRYNEVSNRRSGDYGKKKEGEGRFFRFREYGGVGHYQAKCPTFLRRQKKNYHATLSDEDTDDTEDDSSMNAFTTCFTEIDLIDDSGCSNEDGNKDLSFEELKMLRKEDIKARAIQKERIQDLMEENERLMSVIASLKLKLKEVQNEYDQTIKYVNMLNSGTENLDSILKSGQNSSSKYGLGFDASVSSRNSTSEVSGCSRRMIGNGSFFSELKECVSGYVTFGDGARGRIIAKGNIDKNNLPCLNDVRYVDGLKANLISVSQLQGYSVNFSKTGCVVTDKDNQVLMKGRRQEDKCYHLKGKSDTVKICIGLCLNLQCEKGKKIIKIRSDHGKEFDNEDLNSFCQSEAYKEYHRKWDVKSEQGIFLGYSQNSRAYRVFNNRSGTVIETINVMVNDFESTTKRTYDEDDETLNMPVDSSTLPAEVLKVDAQADGIDINSKTISKEVIADNS